MNTGKLKHTLIPLAIILLTSCQTTFKSPVTQIEYTGEINQEGLSITAKPPLWQYACDLYKWLTN